MTFGILTLGCKVNYYESTAISEMLEEHGLTELPFDSICDIYIINTCAVTGESERKAGQMIRRAVKKNPEAYVIVTGCMAQLDPARTSAVGAHFVCGNREKLRAALAAIEYAEGRAQREQRIIYDDLTSAPFEPMTIKHSDRTRAYVKIGDGCESKCAYCIIKTARGPIRSKPLDLVVSECRALVESGYREIVLTAIELSAYGKDLDGVDLADLILALDGIEGLERLRLGSLDPATVKEGFVRKIARSRTIAPHFHLSVQSGCDRTLRAMRRRYNAGTVKNAVALLKDAFPEVMITADIIVGFPGESEEDHLESASLIRSLGLLSAHVFAFSPRPGTEAAEMSGQIAKNVKSRRSGEIISLCKQSMCACLDRYIGKEVTVLFEEMRGGFCYGHTANFIEVAIPSDTDLHSKTLKVRLESHKDGIMYGRPADNGVTK